MNRTLRPLALALFAATAASASAADLTIDVKGIADARGQILVAVYDTSTKWLGRALRYERAPASSPSMTIQVPGLAAGTYAVSLVHDIDNNGKMDSNAMRIPIEPYGFSNDATGTFGPASFEQARFEVPEKGARISITLQGL